MARPNPSATGEAAVRARPAGLQVAATARRVAGRLPLHLSVIGLAAIWSIPTIALLISSFRDPGHIGLVERHQGPVQLHARQL